MAQIFDAIAKERTFQDKKYGPVLLDGVVGPHEEAGPGGHDLGTWVIILEKETDECKDALVHGGANSKKGRDTVRQELVQVAAVAIAALEQHGLEEPK